MAIQNAIRGVFIGLQRGFKNMAKYKISFGNNVIPVNKIDKKTAKKIENLYIQVSNKIHVQISQLNTTKNKSVTDSLNLYRLNQLQQSINYNLREITGEIEKEIKNTMQHVSEITVEKYLSEINFSLKAAYAHVPNDVITNIITGNLYKNQNGENWEFSKAIWGNYSSTTGEIAKIVQLGIAQNKSAYEIAKDLEKYVNPKAKKPWDWSKVYPNTRKKIDYNAQRLARTMVSHAYQQSIVDCSKINPWVYGIEWRSALTERTCEICEKRHGQVYSPNNIPLDHPNGLCTYIMVFSKDPKAIADDIADWINGKEDTAIDNYAEHLTGIDFKTLSASQKRQAFRQ